MDTNSNGQRVPMSLFGLAFFLAWEILVAPFWNSLGVASPLSETLRSNLISILTAVLLVGAAWIARSGQGRISRLLCESRAVVVYGICAILVPAFEVLQLVVSEAALALDLAGIMAKCVADAGLFLVWNVRLAEQKAYNAWTAYAGSFALAAAIFLAANALGPFVIGVAVFATPLLCCLALVRSAALPHNDPVSEGLVTWKFPWRPVILMVAFSFAYRLVLRAGDDLQDISELGRLIMACVVFLCFVISFDRFDAGLLFKVCPALVVAGLLLCFADGAADTPGLRGFFISAGYSGFTLYVYLTLNTVCYRFGAPAEWLFGLARAACLLVNVLSGFVSFGVVEASSAAAGTFPSTFDMTAGAVAVLLVLLSMLLLTEKTPVTTWGIKAVRIGADELGTVGRQFETIGHLEARVFRCALVARHFGLTHREEEVLSLLAQGSSLQDIEEELSIAHGTMRAHVQHIYQKLDVHSYEEARQVVRDWKA